MIFLSPNEYAKKNGIELSDDQKAKVDEAIEKLQTESEDYLEAVGATDELIEKTYTENAIANLVYMDLVCCIVHRILTFLLFF